MPKFDNEYDEMYFTELPVGFDLRIYNEKCDDFLEISLETEDDPCGEETKKTIHFIQVLLENNVRFSLEPNEGGKWWNSHHEEFKDFMRSTWKSETGGEEG